MGQYYHLRRKDFPQWRLWDRREQIEHTAMNTSPYYAMQLPAPQFSEPHHRAIAEAAYFRAERRGFVRGRELDGWLAAETEIKARLMSESQKL